MTLLLRPLGRGNWAVTTVSVEASRHAPLPLEVHAGQLLTIAGRVFRVCRVLP